MGSSGSKHDVAIEPAFEAALALHTGAPDVVSIGSGFGVTERMLEQKFSRKIVTVDAQIEEFCKPDDMTTAKMPEYKSAAEYKNSADPDVATIMILDWPNPNDVSYGVDAIELLKPATLVIRYASCGAAGSERLQSFLGSCGCPNDGSRVRSRVRSGVNGTYVCVYSDQFVNGSGGGFDGKTIDVVVLKRIV